MKPTLLHRLIVGVTGKLSPLFGVFLLTTLLFSVPPQVEGSSMFEGRVNQIQKEISSLSTDMQKFSQNYTESGRSDLVSRITELENKVYGLQSDIQSSKEKNSEVASNALNLLMQANNLRDDLRAIEEKVHPMVIVPFNKPLPKGRIGTVIKQLQDNPNIDRIEVNWCRDKAPKPPGDEYFKSKGSWGQKYDDQWGLKAIGFTADRKSAWNIEDGSSRPVVVAVIDTGLDWNHKDLDWKNIWNNPNEVPDNGIDDDKNGFIDDVIGWNFIGNDNKPWDEDGHGTFVTGIIAAAHNDIGISGINPGVKIMVVKALNAFGHTRSATIAQAVFYAADNGAEVINISVGGKHLTETEQDAVDYAYEKGAVVVMASGNEASDTANYSSGMRHLITVSATNIENRFTAFSNWGQQVDIAAPGLDILSLRARRTDLMAGLEGVDYEVGAAYVGDDKRYFRAGGTSFAAPMVAGVASLIRAKYPKLTPDQVTNMLLNSAQDIETPGWDQLTGYGLLDARAALKADPDYFTVARVSRIAPAQMGDTIVIQVTGSLDSSDYKNAWMELGFGEEPESWSKVSDSIGNGIHDDVLANIDTSFITQAGKWSVRLMVKTREHGLREARGSLDIQ